MPLIASGVPSHISTEFRRPDELFERTDVAIPHFYDWNARENPNFPLFVYHDGGSEKLEYITYSTANCAIDRVARYTLSSVGPLPEEPCALPPIVGVLASTDSITYFCTIVGILRAGFTAFLVSTRNGSVAVADMVKRTGTTHLLVSPDPVTQRMAEEAAKDLAGSGVLIGQLAMPSFEDLFFNVNVDPASPFEAAVEFPTRYDLDKGGVIFHSSGSTGHPKPLLWTHKLLLASGRLPTNCGVDLRGCIIGCHGVPFFHGMGALMCWASPMSGSVVGLFKPTFPPTVPTPDAVWQGIVMSGADYTFSVPSFVHEWAQDREKVLIMKKRRGLIFGGAPLDEDVGDALAAQGVSLYIVYGSTEAGFINTFIRPNPGMDWVYFSISSRVKCVFRLTGDGTYEAVIISPSEMPLPKTNTQEGGQDAYATSDLVVPHPTQPGLWKIVGRADEQIVLSNGEKTNPLPLEKIINEDSRVECSVMFGRGKFQNGVLIEPTDEFVIDPSDVKQLEAYRNKVWPTIERVNKYAPQHSRIFKEMILVTFPSKPFQYNIKNLPRRGIILGEYNEEIEALYKEIENSSQSEFAPPTTWDAISTLTFVRTIVEGTLRRTISDDADIFRNGGDSLQATWIRNTVLRAIRETDSAAAKRLPTNLVFQAPTISALASIVGSVANQLGSDGAPRTPEDLWKHVERFSANLPARPANLIDRPTGKDVVLITGTTGGFGCDTLEHLLRDETVERVYAFNRKGARAMERQRAQFRARGLDESLLNSPKFRMVEAVLHEPGFALEQELLDGVRRSVTHILHNAWKVDFNMSIASFEVDIQGARNLVDLALSSPYAKPPPIVFVSSIGILQNCEIPPPVPEMPIDDPTSPFGTGYSEAKWVTEHMLQNATETTGLHTVVTRLGQVAGDRLGYWNEREWFPALVKSALFQRCLPDMEGEVSWFPAYEAAQAFAEMRHSPEPILHLVHPRPVPWHTVMAPIAELLGVPLVPYERWLTALEQSVDSGSVDEVETMKLNPALRLLPFFKGQGQTLTSDREPMGLVRLSTEKAIKVSESLACLPTLDAQRAERWVEAWKRAGFLY